MRTGRAGSVAIGFKAVLRIGAALAVFGVVVALQPPGRADGVVNAKFKLVPAFQAAPIGHPFPIVYEVRIDDVTDPDGLGAFQFDLQFDPSVVAWTPPPTPADGMGPFLGSTGRAVTCLDQTLVAPDTIRYRCFTLGSEPAGPTGGGVVAKIRFIQLNNEAQGWLDFLGHGNEGEETKALDITGAEMPSELVTYLTDANDIPHEGQISVVTCYDFDGDGNSTILDLAQVSAVFGATIGDPEYNPAYDTDSDGQISIIDLSRVAASFGLTCPA